MKGREFSKTSSGPSTDFLVCFPSRAHLALLSKPVSSPVRLLQLPEPNSRPTRHQPPPPQPQQGPRRLKKSGTARRPQASPVLWSKNKQMGSGSSVTSEPTSPKVTCAGQIKVRHKSGAGRSWQSVMAEIEKIHDGKTKKRGDSSMLGFSKEIMQFLTCLKNVRFNFRCFGSFPEPEITSDDDDEDEEDDGDQECNKYDESDDQSRAVFSKWFMVLKENQNFPAGSDEGHRKSSQRCGSWDEGSFAAAVPPPNALLLMRCRSAPAKSWLEEKMEEEERVAMEKESDGTENDAVEEDGGKLMESEKKNILKLLMDEEKREEEEDRKRKQSMFFEGYDTDYYKISTDVAKETWVVGATAMSDSLIRCPTIRR